MRHQDLRGSWCRVRLGTSDGGRWLHPVLPPPSAIGRRRAGHLAAALPTGGAAVFFPMPNDDSAGENQLQRGVNASRGGDGTPRVVCARRVTPARRATRRRWNPSEGQAHREALESGGVAHPSRADAVGARIARPCRASRMRTPGLLASATSRARAGLFFSTTEADATSCYASPTPADRSGRSSARSDVMAGDRGVTSPCAPHRCVS